MAATHHADQEFVAGDAWTIVGTLTDVDDGPLDITNATVMWILLDTDGKVVDLAAPIELAKSDPAKGEVTITVPGAATQALDPGFYVDAMRVVINDVPSTMWTGVIRVDANPWGTAA